MMWCVDEAADELVLCGRCGETKPRWAFYNLPHTTDPRRPCKTCTSEYKRARYAAKGGDRASHAQVLREKYRLTPEQYDAMLTDQRGLCAICGRPEVTRGRGGVPRRLAVDHDHRTGAVRKLLCHRCNLVTWAVEENPAILEVVRRYLAEHSRRGSE
jgi:Fe-S oxidoreductase